MGIHKMMSISLAVLSIAVLLHGNVFVSGAVIVAKEPNTHPTEDNSTDLPLVGVEKPTTSKNETSSGGFQIVVKDYVEDDNNRVAASNETEKTSTTAQPAVTTTKSPSELKIQYLHKYFANTHNSAQEVETDDLPISKGESKCLCLYLIKVFSQKFTKSGSSFGRFSTVQVFCFRWLTWLILIVAHCDVHTEPTEWREFVSRLFPCGWV